MTPTCNADVLLFNTVLVPLIAKYNRITHDMAYPQNIVLIDDDHDDYEIFMMVLAAIDKEHAVHLL